jgi:hypothetical protein
MSLKLVPFIAGALATAFVWSVSAIALRPNEVAVKNALNTPLEVHVTNAPSSTLSRFGTLHARGQCVKLVGMWDDETMRGKKVVNAQVAPGACRTNDGERGINIVVFWQD